MRTTLTASPPGVPPRSVATFGQPISALVLNRARDGRPYWVVALATPIADGYLSVRFKPTTGISATVRDLYVKLRAVEACCFLARGFNTTHANRCLFHIFRSEEYCLRAIRQAVHLL